MASVTRREVLKLLGMTAAGGIMMQATRGLSHALTAVQNPPNIVWVNEGGTDLNLLGLLGQFVPNFSELVTLQWNIVDFDALMPTAYASSGSKLKNAPVVILERIPANETLPDGSPHPVIGLLKEAKVAIMLGTEACYGGFITPVGDISRVEGWCRQSKTPFIKLPGVPPPPHHLVGTLAYLEYFGFPALDTHHRPMMYYGQTVCEHCERRGDLDAGRFAEAPGDVGCLLMQGCKGLVTHNSCSKSRWNDKESWCVSSGGPCTGCSEPGFPDHGGLGLYGRLPADQRGPRSWVWENLEELGYALMALVGTGVAAQGIRRLFYPEPHDDSALADKGRKRK